MESKTSSSSSVRKADRAEAKVASALRVEPSAATRLCILDWDDTLCPSSWISSNSDPVTERDLLILRSVEEGISNLLRCLESLGCSVVIITNADEEWVQFSCARFLHRVVPLLSRVHVVSARQYEGIYPGRSVCWKAAAFTHVAKAFFASRDCDDALPREIISIGDSNDERLAVRAAAAPLRATPKAIKLIDSPRLHTVACQIHTVTSCLPSIVHSDHALDVDVATILNYMHVKARSDAGVADISEDDNPELLRRIWHDAAWGLLAAIRFQGLGTLPDPKPQPTLPPVEPRSPQPMPELPAAA
mmetsp:Transcript_13845/g.43750  ORF Transcript_13845/g.43750 Transcript_13845/m.43750 type:complete len:303 (-) Transcript_13845:395-1303(-)